MKWLEALFGQARVPKSRLERLFALSTAHVTLETSFGLHSTGRAGLAFRATKSSYFEAAERELEELLEAATTETGTTSSRKRDDYGFDWLVLEDDELEDLVAAAHLMGQTLQDHGFGDRLLAALFAFQPVVLRQAQDERGGQRSAVNAERIYWVYNYKRASFYPFVPLPGPQRRDNALELRLSAVMRRELPVEQDQGRWYALWGAPV